MNKEISNKILLWDNFKELEPSLKKELNDLKQNEDLLLDAFSDDIAFGTGGLRGVLGVGTNRMNTYVVQKTTLGFANYLNLQFPNVKKCSVVISYDCRSQSLEFAKVSAQVLATKGFVVYIFDGISSTPELSFAVRHLKCSGGIMITASHNPPQYNGYKVYDELGCQLVPDLSLNLTKEIDKIKDMFHIDKRDFQELVDDKLIQWIGKDVDNAYLEQVKTVTVQEVEKKNISIVYTPLHGTGSKLMVRLLTECGYNITPVKEQMVADSQFRTLILPNPEDSRAFDLAKQLGHKIHADVLIATDPDADRMGIAALDALGEYVLLTGNQTGAILLDYLTKYKHIKKLGVVFNTIVTSDIAKAICKKHNLELEQTLTGFKFIGEKAKELENSKDRQFFFGYEESYGYVIKDFVRDKDSHQATLLLSEVASFYKAQNKTLIQVLDDIYKEYGYYEEGVENIALAGVEGAQRIQKIMNTFENLTIHSIAGREIARFEDYEKSISFENGKEEKLLLPKSFVLKYIFVGGGWFVLRPSGTEPKLKIYIAIKDKTKENALSFIALVKKELLHMIDSIK